MAEINEDRENHGKKPFDGPKPPEEKEITASATDPESGMFHKGEHKNALHIQHRQAAIKTDM